MQTKCAPTQQSRWILASAAGQGIVKAIATALVLLVLSAPAGWAQDPSQPVGISSLMAGLVLWDQCGWEGARPCTPSDPIYGAANSTTAFFSTATGSCDRTLVPISGVCTDLGARAAPTVPASYVPAWLSFQQSDQYDRISADLPINLAPIMGTHNSYSNSFDGGSDIFNLDQFFTITDQLNLGARFIRLDPVLNSTGLSAMGCHASEWPSNTQSIVNEFNNDFNLNLPATASQLCNVQITNLYAAESLDGVISYQRPIYLAVEEIKHWLDKNPGEVVVITVNNFYSFGQSGYVTPHDLSAIFEHVLGNMLLTPGQFQSYSSLSWPTQRQIRSLGKQAIVMFSQTTGVPAVTADALPDVWSPVTPVSSGDWNSTSMPNFNYCWDYDGYIVGPGRVASTVENIGEDRSLSNSYNPANENGLMTWLSTAIATGCGYNTISLDFLYSLNKAVDNTYINLTSLKVQSVNYTTGGNFYSEDQGTDERPQWTVWSWLRKSTASSTPEPAALVHQTSLSSEDLIANAIFQGYGATATLMTHRWQQMDPGTGLPFACAGPGSSGVFPDAGDMWNYRWAITSATGPWIKGEQLCQSEFGAGFHFWRPMSAPENEGLAGSMLSKSVERVWLNHYPGNTVALPSVVNLTHTYNASQTATDIIVTSGFGGALSAAFTPDSNNPDFIAISQSIPGSNIFQIAVNDAALAASPSGSYRGTLTVTERHPDGTPSTSSNVLITLNFAVNHFTVSPASVNFVSSLTRTLQLESAPGQVSFTYDQTQTPKWLTVSFSSMKTPATMTLTANPSTAPQQANVNLTVTPTDTTYPAATVSAGIQTVQVPVATSPNGIPLTIDGITVTPPATVTWVAGSSHQLTAVQNYSAFAGTIYQFQGWTGAVSSNSASTGVTAPSQPTGIVAQYGVYYTLTAMASPANSGTVTASPAPNANGGYPAGAQVVLTATPSAGYVFKQFTGSIGNQQSTATVTMDHPASVTALFVPAQGLTTFNTNPAGLSIAVDGVSYPTPASFAWATTESHSVSGPAQSGSQAGVQYVFSKWNDNSTASPRMFSGSSTAVTYTLDFNPQYLVSTQVTPSLSGTVSGGGWFAPNATATLQAAAATGFGFSSFSGGVASGKNPLQFTVTGSLQVTANFTAASPPVLYASAGARVDQGNGTVLTPIVLNDLPGAGPAGDATITAVTVSGVPTGAGMPVVTFPTGGIALGTIFPGQSSQTTLTVAWPTSATRATFTIQYMANGGAYRSSNSISIYR